MNEINSFNRKIIKTIFISLLMLSVFALIVFHIDFFLLVFGGVLCAVVLNYTSNLISERFKPKYGLSFIILFMLIVILIGSIVIIIGPYLGLVPTVLIAFLDGPIKALYVIVLYTIIQIIETYMITPFIEKKMVSLLPVLTILCMILIGLLTGVLGLILSTPILVVLMVLIEEFYVKDYLEKQNEVVS